MASTIVRFESSAFLPVGTPKTPVCITPVDNEERLHHRIVDACQTVRNYPGVFQRTRRSMSRALNIMEGILSR
jgi:hypothetical protein